MNKHLLFLFIFLLISNFQKVHAQCMMVPVSLKQRTENAQTIVLGKLKEKHSYFDESRKNIYTLNIIEITAYLKGNKGHQIIALITDGGVVGDKAQITFPTIEVEDFNEYIFFLKEDNKVIDDKTYRSQYPNVIQAEAYASSQGAITKQFGYYHDLYSEPKSTEAEIFDRIKSYTKTNVTDITGQPFAARAVGKVPKVSRPISGFLPSTTHAGTIDPADFITISGSGFGAGAGTVFYTNADDGGATFTASGVATDNTAWSATSVTNKVARAAGTGPININGAMTSATSLTVDYAHLNINSTFSGFGSSTRQRYYLRNKNGSGGYTFVYNTTSGFNGNAAAVASFERALETWRCDVFVNFDAGGTTATGFGLDGENVVMFDASIPVGALAVATSRFSGSASGGCTLANTVWWLDEVDIRVYPDPPVPGFPWNYGPGASAFTEYDFESVLLHELGHALGLGHTIAAAQVMHFAIANGSDKRVLAAQEIAGGNAKMAYSTTATCFNPGGSGTPMVALTAGTCGLALPVELFTFTGKYNETPNNVLLEWTTASEHNSDKFIIEKSLDGKTYQPIGTVAATGNSAVPVNYNLTDNNPAHGLNYYRLKQVDVDAKYNYSKVVSVYVNHSGNISIYPNPVKNELYISSSELNNASVTIYNALGESVKSISGLHGAQAIIDTKDLVNGIYFVRVQNGNFSSVKKFIIEK